MMQLNKTKCLELINSYCDFLPRKYTLKDIYFYKYFKENKNKHFIMNFFIDDYVYMKFIVTNYKNGEVRLAVNVHRYVEENDKYVCTRRGTLYFRNDAVVFNSLKEEDLEIYE